MKNLLLLFATTLLIISSGCVHTKVTKHTKLQISKTVPANFNTPSLLRELNALQTGQTLNVILVHGMGTKHINEFDNTVKYLAMYLELDSLTFKESYCVGSSDTNTFPNLKVHRYHKDNKQVQFTYVHWSPATRSYKADVTFVDTHSGESCANKAAKDMIVNDGFGDFMALLDPAVQRKTFIALECAFLLQYVDLSKIDNEITREVLHAGIEQDSKNKSKNILISSSLGSKLTHEFISNYISWLEIFERHYFEYEGISLQSMNSAKQIKMNGLDVDGIVALQNNLKNRRQVWFTFSNQLVLFEACKYNIRNTMEQLYYSEPDKMEKSMGVKFSNTSTQDFYNRTETNRMQLRKRTTLVGFYDMNDLLGFKIPDRTYQDSITADTVINIQIPIQNKIALGYYSNPLQAHSGSKTHPYVMHLIANGWNGKLESLPKPKAMKTRIKKSYLFKMATFIEN